VTPAEIRASILGMKDAIARAETTLVVLVAQREEDRKAIHDLEAQRAEHQTRIVLLERDGEIRAKRESALRAFRIGFWIAVFSAVASFVGSLVVAYYSSGVKR
jgi:hypothetical protein